MARFKEEWVRFTKAAHDFDSYILTFGKPDRTVLVLLDEVSSECLEEGRVMTGARLSTFRNAFSRALRDHKKDGEPLNCCFVITAVLNDRNELNFGHNLTQIIKNVKPDSVLSFGLRVNKSLAQTQSWLRYLGRVRESFITYEYKGKERKRRFELVPSFPAWGWTDPKPSIKDENAGGMVNLIGQVVKHIRSSITGKCEGNINVPQNPKYPAGFDYTFVDTMKKFRRFMRKLRKARVASIDTEGTSLGTITSDLLSYQFYLEKFDESGEPIFDKSTLFFIPLKHRQTPFLPKELNKIMRDLREYFEEGKSEVYDVREIRRNRKKSGAGKKCYHVYQNGKYDVKQAYSNLGCRWYNHLLYDTQAGEFSLEENWKFSNGLGYKPYSLEFMENRYGYVRSETLLSKADRANMAEKDIKDIADYGMIDVVTPYLIHREQIRIASARRYENFFNMVAHQIGNMLLVFSIMEHNGMPVDKDYIQSLQADDSVLNVAVNGMLEEFKKSKAANRVNDRLIKEQGWQEEGMFGKVKKPWLFNIDVQNHAQELYFKELKLKALATGATDKGSLNDVFQKAYKHIPEVAAYSKYSKAKKIKTGFSEALHGRLLTDPDAIKDGNIRSEYKYLGVVTGRSSSTNPNLQNQPERGEFAKLIKRIFCVRHGDIQLKADFSAHEVRGFGNIALDKLIGKAFESARKAIFRVRTCKPEDLDEAIKIMKVEGDIHIQNVKLFFNQIVDKNHHLRYAIKAVVFGVLYGKQAKALSRDINNDKSERARLEAEIKILKEAIKLAA